MSQKLVQKILINPKYLKYIHGLNIRSGVLSEPVTRNFVGSEGLFSELLVATGSEGIDLESVGGTVDEVILGEEVRDGEHHTSGGQNHNENHLSVRDLGSGNEHEILGDVMSHLRGR